MQLTVRDVAGLLNVSEKTIYRWIKAGTIPAYRVNEQYRFQRSELLEWVQSRKIAVSADIYTEVSIPVPSLTEAIRTGGIVYRLNGSTREEVLASAVRAMRLPDEVDREQLLRVFIAREELASTGIGEGIAIPHVRNPVVMHVSRPTVTLCFLERPIDFGAIDGQPVYCLFTMISPTVRAHLMLLSRLSFALRDPGVADAVKRAALRDEILDVFSRAEAGMPTPAPAAGSDHA